jgi:hypothetical protein
VVAEIEPGVRRLCVGIRADRPGFIASARDAIGANRLYVSADPDDGIEVAIAPPGVDEVGLVRHLVAELSRLVSIDSDLREPVIVAFYSGIVRVVDDGFGGAGVARVRGLVRDRAVGEAADEHGHARGAPVLTVVISDGFFADLSAEGMPSEGWQFFTSVSAWLQSFGSGTPAGMEWALGAPGN